MNEREMTNAEVEALERILADEDEIQPMTGFSARVMRAVREEAAAPPPISFPWSRFVPGLVLNVGLLAACLVWLLPDLAAAPAPELLFSTRLADPIFRGVLWVASVWTGSAVLMWATLGWVAPRRGSTI